MLCVPAARVLMEQVALFVLPLPLRATALQPLNGLPFAVNPTVPVGLLPVTVALKATLVPCIAGLAELTRVVLLAGKPVGAPPHASISMMRE